ncbi:fluoride efflux transporter CrcB [Myxosarcina sp. GI1]|uniref:fluoride efflux transporter CrcB n=1 Tax=Myxosarcina sp. GI1 TaxID=1541065 RepID=UPI00068E9486|nr:fluoride efflux transporter CrcB [Myxosarcina sp. GI1]
MELILNNLFNFITIAPHFVPEVLQKPSVRNPIAVSLGAISGSLSRYYLSLWLPQILGTDFPYATLFVNLSGSFAMGIIITLVLERALPIAPEIRLLIAIGFLGSYTTFSSYELDTVNLIREFSWQTAIFYWFGSAISGFFFLYLGIVFARVIRL